MESEFDINAYATNQTFLYAVQGESQSRNVIFNIIEKSGIQIPTSNATVVNKMLDLTDYTLTMYIKKPNGEVVNFIGSIVDAINGKATFTIPKEAVNISGTASCCIVMTKTNIDLRIVGINLNIANADIQSSNELIMYKGTSKIINIIIMNDDKSIYNLQSGDKIIFGVKSSIDTSNYILKVISDSTNKSGDGYNISIIVNATQNMLGNYIYDVGLQTASGDYYIIVPCAAFKVLPAVTQKE